ncbi:MAG: MotA/TolQ/ExbB proton channel family protein [bacterium]
MAETIPAASGGFFDPFLRAGIFAQIIMLLLLAASVISWAVIIGKSRSLRRARQETREFQSLFRHGARLSDYEAMARKLSASPLSAMLLAGVAEWNSLDEHLAGQPDRAGLLQQLIPNVTEAMGRASSRELDRLESRMAFLAITASVAPFLGLLGTVQGVLRSFLALRGQEFVTLQVLAPGISDALITTVVGLLVAIPAAFFYNSLTARVRDLESEMTRFISELTGIFRRHTLTGHIARPHRDEERL